MMGCDGVWDVVSPEEAMFELEGITDPHQMAQKLVNSLSFSRFYLCCSASLVVNLFLRELKFCCSQVELSLDKGTTDNTTALIIRFNDI
jgi:serine/threonine protein phosphatase PrpC